MTIDYENVIPKLKIALLVVGTRGDVQPFLALALRLQEYGHCVRLATHSQFDGFVSSAGVNFYPLGGDPRIMAECFVRARSILTPRPRDMALQRKQLRNVIESLLPACTQPDPVSTEPFRAEAIIANPPAFGSKDIAEALGVPLHIMFTVPWTPTRAFPHPFTQRAGRLSYALVDLMIWWGIRGFINGMRKNKLNLSPIGFLNSRHISISQVPTSYMWSSHVLPKPNEWGPLVDVVGYCFLNLGSKYEASEDFVEWMQKGKKPIYFGFGSVKSEKVTCMILEALKKTGQRGIIDPGWGDLGTNVDIPQDVFVLSDCPHDWLFPQCDGVVHHGGPGTAAAGLKAGCPTTVVPFCGDQFLWGKIMHEKGVGGLPIPIQHLSVQALTEAINFMLQPQVKSRALELAEKIALEDGVGAAFRAFHRHLPNMENKHGRSDA
ncbi:sterol 3-beta-glucosyltransferase UGT80B1-like isoform X2 [Salvia hispanica]|uniref:sterol 3-beta-glucosyltransferase UGT80B1-like isoform X2 n=1 Tax=Salvia hispanica TaxID=49212 RepID=UPI002009DA0D|nr:sterol 3-beta-glucosyltransferase UGT80B1-like isoform X2 [Salvia hispanica]